MLFTVHVTQDHIDRGRPDHAHECPVALAIWDALGQQYGGMDPAVAVYGLYARIRTEWYFLSRQVKNWIYEYDRGRPGVPFTFTIDTENDRIYGYLGERRENGT